MDPDLCERKAAAKDQHHLANFSYTQPSFQFTPPRFSFREHLFRQHAPSIILDHLDRIRLIYPIAHLAIRLEVFLQARVKKQLAKLSSSRLFKSIAGAIERSGKDEIAVRSAALAYYGILSLFPLLLFLVFLGSQFLESAAARSALNDGLEQLIPAASEIVRQAVDQSVTARGSIGLIAGIGLLWSASTLFNALTTSLNAIWDASPRPFWKRRAIAAFSVLTIGLLFLASITLSAMAAIPLPGQLTGLVRWVNFSVGIFASVLLFWIVYHGIPNKTVNPRATLAGATLAAILWQLAKSAFALYISSGITNYGAIYGSLASVIALILWAYISALILFLGAEFGAALQREFWT